ncbi:MAG: tail fiber domain-containing protein, partial [candidate division Zixibacteria bacterium]|nr:tail fiber domain-containing protein [candidate division Zixibacteria bacterium]
YLEVSVGGITLSPRMQLSSVPSALSSGHVSGDIETAPGMFTVTNTGSATTGALRMKATPDSAVTHLEDDPDHDGSAQSKIDQAVTHLNSKIDMARDVNNDGVMDMSVEMATDNDSASLRLNGLPPGIPVTGTLSMSASGTGARSALEGRSGSTTGTIRMMATPDSASEVMEKKGLNAVNVKLARTISSSPGGPVAADALDVDSDDDGVMDRSVSSDCDDTGARSILKGGMSGSTTGTIRMQATPDSTISVLGHDSDGDGSPESSIKFQARSKQSEAKANVKSAYTAQSVMYSDTASGGFVTSLDVDNDGIPESSTEEISTATGSRNTLLGGHMGSTTGTIRMQATGGGPVMPSGEILLEADLDGDGVAEVTSADSVGAAGASRRLKSSGIGSSGNDGVEVQLSARPSGAYIGIGHSQNAQTLRCSGSADSAAATILLEADLDGDGVMEKQVSSTVDSGQASIAIDEPGVQVAMGMRKGWDGTIKGRFTVDEGATRKIELNSDGDGYLAGKIGIGKDPIEKIDVAGGAYCDGANWVNFSDVNSKENFTAVDGNELLEQIAQLSITRWNYKGDNQAEHIGPMAQDFKAAFGVGANDKSISTIDPSGIALAAIKALNSKMQELNAKTTQLEDQAREISQLKAELDAIKVMLQKQATTKN